MFHRPEGAVLVAAVLAASCGGGALPGPDPSPDAPSLVADTVGGEAETAGVEWAEAEPAWVESAGTELAGVESAGSEPAGVESAESEPAGVESAGTERAGVESAGTERAGVESAEAEPAGVEWEPEPVRVAAELAPPDEAALAEGIVPSTTVSATAWVDAGEPVLDSALEAMLRDLKMHPVAAVSFFYVTEARVAAQLCVKQPGDGAGYRHVQRIVDLGVSGWEVGGRFDIRGHEGLESCTASFE